ncbi:MAG: retroviral-like aspartic protease family protein [Treponemataceae bacterium]|nr:retroviral-like aspartic protease family protein [Treponemataceae bacterium]
MAEYHAFTLNPGRKLTRLKTNALVLSDVRNTATTCTPKMWNAIWDTGATKTCITKRIADDLNLIPIGRATISTANGIITTNTYSVHIGLPNGVTIQNILVSCANLGADTDILIGMDIITLGDFSITNVNGRTVFSFRIPSVEEVDFQKA